MREYIDNVLEDFKTIDEEQAKTYIRLLFEGYNKRKKEKRLFGESTLVPELIILTYYACVQKLPFYNIYDNFKKKYMADDSAKNFKERYIYNENKLEEVHTKEEQLGLRRVYDYIQEKEDLSDINLYTLSDIHEILYSLTPYPEFGGKYRNDLRFLPNTGINLTSPYFIVREMNELRDEVDDLVTLGNSLGQSSHPEQLLEYVDRCVELKCKLVKIHPFGDGNGRSVRAFTNMLFRLANLPPVYVENKERVKYGEAMQSALGDNDLSKIKGFYYYKICDSIISLDSHFTKSVDSKETIDEPMVKKLSNINK